ncbi:class I SAM-dependent methyltransferase [Roseibium sp. LAB1]
MSLFSGDASTAGYAERTARLVPGLADMHKMAGLLLAERAPAKGTILVLGAGGGVELTAFARMQPDWRFCGVDPSADMLEKARVHLGPLGARVQLLEGYIEDAPDKLFDGAACLLTLHFLNQDERLKTLLELRRRLKPGAVFVAVHHSFPTDPAGKDRWLARFAAFSAESGVPRSLTESGLAAMKERLPVLAPEQDADLLRQAGFVDVETFYSAFTFRGWVAVAG